MSWSVRTAITNIPQTRELKQQTFIFVLQMGKSRVKVLADPVPSACFLVFRWPPSRSLSEHTAEREESSVVFFYESIHLILEHSVLTQ